MQDTLGALLNHRQNDWDKLLSLCEFEINNSDQASTENTFFLNHGCHPITPPPSLVTKQTSRTMDMAEAGLKHFVRHKHAIVAAQARQSLYADRRRLEDTLKEGEEVIASKDFC